MSQPGARAQAVAEEVVDDWYIAWPDVKVKAADRRQLALDIAQAIQAAVEAERERCAKVAETPLGHGLSDFCDHWGPRIAQAIRHEGEPSNPTLPPTA